MLVSFSHLLRSHGEHRSALCAFTCYNFEPAVGVLEAARQATTGVVLLISEASFASPHGRSLTSA